MTWERTTLKSVATSIQYGYTASATDEAVGPKLLRITDITPEYIDWDTVPFCRIDDSKLPKYKLEPGDIVIARTGYPGYAKLIRNDQHAVFASYLVRVQIDLTRALPAYVGRLIESAIYRRYVDGRKGGVAQGNANAQVLASFPFDLPPLRTQQGVADMLSAYDDLMEGNRRRMKLLEDAARLLYQEWFVRLRFPDHERVRIINGVPEGWERIHLADKVTTQYGYTETATDEEVGPKFLRGTDINKAPHIDWSTVPYCPIDDAEKRKYQLRVGDILVIRMADPGKVAIVERDIDAVFASYLIRIVPTDARLTPYYLFYSLSGDAYQGFISGVCEKSTRKTASAPLLVDFHLNLPPEPLARLFEEAVQPLRRQVTILLIQNEKLRAARDLLLPRLMSGEVEVSALSAD